MNIKYLRSSSITTYQDCQFKYFLEYILGLPSPSGKKAMLGTIVHHVLELMAKASKVSNMGKSRDPVYLLEICWERYTKEDTAFELTDADRRFCKRTIDKVVESAYNPLGLKVIDIEKQFRLPVLSGGFDYTFYDVLSGEISAGNGELRGTMDLVTELDKDTIEIIDWKTGRRNCWVTGKLKDYDYLFNNDIQLRMYDLASYILYPQYKHRLLTMHYVNQGGPFTLTFDDNERNRTLEILKDHFNCILSNHQPSRIKEERRKSSWKCNKVCSFGKEKASNGNCWCDNIFYYLVHNGIDKTILKVDELRNQKMSDAKAVNLTSNRRNVFN